MEKQKYIDSFFECKNIEEINNLLGLAKEDPELTIEELQEITDEACDHSDSFRAGVFFRGEAEQEDYMYGTPDTDDELGLT